MKKINPMVLAVVLSSFFLTTGFGMFGGGKKDSQTKSKNNSAPAASGQTSTDKALSGAGTFVDTYPKGTQKPTNTAPLSQEDAEAMKKQVEQMASDVQRANDAKVAVTASNAIASLNGVPGVGVSAVPSIPQIPAAPTAATTGITASANVNDSNVPGIDRGVQNAIQTAKQARDLQDTLAKIKAEQERIRKEQEKIREERRRLQQQTGSVTAVKPQTPAR